MTGSFGKTANVTFYKCKFSCQQGNNANDSIVKDILTFEIKRRLNHRFTLAALSPFSLANVMSGFTSKI
jgi:hypothetical protein